MDNITLRQLRYFDALARVGHFGRAADSCAISQPALSVQIKELETSLGTPLFERGPRHVRLTGFGEAFAQRVKGILRAVDELSDMARTAEGRLTGRLRLGVIPTIAPYLLPTFLRLLPETHAGLDISLRETMTARLIGELNDGQLDAAIVALPVSEPGLTEVALFEENMVLLRPASEADHPAPSPAELTGLRLLLLEEGHCFRDQALSFCNLPGGPARDGLDGTSLSTLVQMVGAGMGVTLIPEMALPVEGRSAPVSATGFAGGQPSRRVGMIWRDSTPLADHLMQIASVVEQAGRDILRSARG